MSVEKPQFRIKSNNASSDEDRVGLGSGRPSYYRLSLISTAFLLTVGSPALADESPAVDPVSVEDLVIDEGIVGGDDLATMPFDVVEEGFGSGWSNDNIGLGPEIDRPDQSVLGSEDDTKDMSEVEVDDLVIDLDDGVVSVDQDSLGALFTQQDSLGDTAARSEEIDTNPRPEIEVSIDGFTSLGRDNGSLVVDGEQSERVQTVAFVSNAAPVSRSRETDDDSDRDVRASDVPASGDDDGVDTERVIYVKANENDAERDGQAIDTSTEETEPVLVTYDDGCQIVLEGDDFDGKRCMDAVWQLISDAEISGTDNYEAFHGNVKNTEIKLTDMTITELIKHMDSRRFSASGWPQIVKGTLEGWIIPNMGLDPDVDKFTEGMQIEMGKELFRNKRAGRDYLAEKITLEEMALELAKEWAGIPSGPHNLSYYESDINTALVEWNYVLEALAEIAEPYEGPGVEVDFRELGNNVTHDGYIIDGTDIIESPGIEDGDSTKVDDTFTADEVVDVSELIMDESYDHESVDVDDEETDTYSVSVSNIDDYIIDIELDDDSEESEDADGSELSEPDTTDVTISIDSLLIEDETEESPSDDETGDTDSSDAVDPDSDNQASDTESVEESPEDDEPTSASLSPDLAEEYDDEDTDATVVDLDDWLISDDDLDQIDQETDLTTDNIQPGDNDGDSTVDVTDVTDTTVVDIDDWLIGGTDEDLVDDITPDTDEDLITDDGSGANDLDDEEQHKSETANSITVSIENSGDYEIEVPEVSLDGGIDSRSEPDDETLDQQDLAYEQEQVEVSAEPVEDAVETSEAAGSQEELDSGSPEPVSVESLLIDEVDSSFDEARDDNDSPTIMPTDEDDQPIDDANTFDDEVQGGVFSVDDLVIEVESALGDSDAGGSADDELADDTSDTDIEDRDSNVEPPEGITEDVNYEEEVDSLLVRAEN
jgi:hypothetical protein